MKVLNVSNAVFMAAFSSADIFWRDISGTQKTLQLMAGKLVGGSLVLFSTIKQDASPLTTFIAEELEAGNEYQPYDDGSGGSLENEGVLAIVAHLSA